MSAFQTPVDITNRGLQHCGAPRLDATLGFSENSKRARELGFMYDKLRPAELQRSVWTFATRKAPIRPIDTNTLKLQGALWVSTVTYFVGSIVSDSANNLWISRIPNNLGNPPTSASGTVSPTYWEPYFGPLTVSLYDSTQAYFAGELVYTAAGDGTYNTYLSLMSGNPVHPALPNQWSTQTVYFRNQVVQTWPAYNAGTTYSKGQGILYTDGNVYASLTAGNIGNTPPSSASNWALVPVLTLLTQTAPATVPFTAFPATSPVIEWAQATGYALGNVVMFNGIEYLSLVNSNTGNFPDSAASTSWIAISNYTLSMSLIDLNIGNNPANAPAAWSSLTTYATGNTVYNVSDGLIYTSLQNSNLNHPPSTSPTWWSTANVLCPWTTVFVQGGGNDMWMQIGGASFPNGVGLAALNITYPIGSGPWSQTWTNNVYRLPSGYLKKTSQDPKAGSNSFLGAPGNPIQNDWVINGNYLVTMCTTPIVLRFIADVQDVSQMHDMFCEMLAARLGLEVAPTLTDSAAKVQMITGAYAKAKAEAIEQNAIEVGAEEPPLDDWLACRY